MQLDDVLKSLDQSESEVITIMKGMIPIQAMSPSNGGDGESARADYLQDLLKGFDSIERYDTEDPDHSGVIRANLVARRNGRRKGTVWLITHMDTVPSGDVSDWTFPPFEATVSDGRIYGRGTEDNGQSMVGVIIAANRMCEMEFNGMSLAVAFVADEETGSVCGIKHLLDLGLFTEDDFILVPDWGAPDGSMVEIAEKQILWVRISITGKQTHGSTPNKGINAFRAGMEFSVDLNRRLEERYSGEDPIFRPGRSTFEPTKATANIGSINMIPGYYEFCMDCRILPGYDPKEIVDFMQSVAAEHSARTGATIEVNEEQLNVSGIPSVTDTECFRKFAESVKEVNGIDVEAVGIGGGTCANFFRLRGMNAYAWGSDGGSLHQPDEWVSMKTLIRDAKVFATMIHKMCVE